LEVSIFGFVEFLDYYENLDRLNRLREVMEYQFDLDLLSSRHLHIPPVEEIVIELPVFDRTGVLPPLPDAQNG